MPAASLALLISNLAIVVAAGIRYDATSCFQGRLLFPSMACILVILARAFCSLEGARWGRIAIDTAMVLLLAVNAGFLMLVVMPS